MYVPPLWHAFEKEGLRFRVTPACAKIDGQTFRSSGINTVSMSFPLFRIRLSRSGPELRLLRAALRCGLPISSADLLMLREPELPTGVPDLIAVEPHHSSRLIVFKRRKLKRCHLQILHFLNDCGATTLLEISRLLNLAARQAEQALEDLETVGLVLRQREYFAPCSITRAFHAKRIVAIEVKIRAWRHALEQAMANLWFASHSYILVPALKCLRTICQEAKKFGIGVLVFDGKQTRTALRARKQYIPASYGSWLINEWAIAQMR